MKVRQIVGWLLIAIGSLDFVTSIAVIRKELEKHVLSNWLILVFLLAIGLFLIGSGWRELDRIKEGSP